MTIRVKLVLFGALLTILPSMILVISNLSMNRNILGTAMEFNHKQGVESLETVVDDVARMCALAQASGADKNQLLNAVSKIRVTGGGYVYILQGSGQKQGTYILSLDRKRDGENIWNSQDSNGNYFVQEICRKGMQLREGENAVMVYPWKNQGDDKPKDKIVSLAYYAPWDWVIGAGTYTDDFQKSAEKIRAINSQAMNVLMVVALIAILASLALAWFMANGISGNIKKAVDFAEIFRQGDISQRNNSHEKDETGDLMRILDQMADEVQAKVELAERIASGDLQHSITPSSERDTFSKSLLKMSRSLSEIIVQVKSTSEQIAAGAVQLTGASTSLSQGATEQASSLEEISSSVTELSSQTKINAENASQANQLAKTAKQSATSGTQQVSEMMTAMNGIQTSSRDIVKIIKVIDDIAFQTNLLALNAAVEAARAGKHGKGFAVVAEEVRSLAARSAKAAKETSELISESMQKVENGIQVASQTVTALEQIDGGVTKVTDLVAEIAASSNEQAQGISQINQGLNQIDTVTQRNTASAEETASAAQELSSRAEQLKQLMQKFKMAESEKNEFMAETGMLSDARRGQGSRAALPGKKSGNGWGHAAPGRLETKTESLPPAAVIALDDKEFGKY